MEDGEFSVIITWWFSMSNQTRVAVVKVKDFNNPFKAVKEAGGCKVTSTRLLRETLA